MYRELRDDEKYRIAQQIIDSSDASDLLDFIEEVWGKEAHEVMVVVDHGKYGGVVETVHVYASQDVEFLPDFSLDYWQQLLKETPGFFGDAEDVEAKLEVIHDHLRDEGVYQEYGVPTSDDYDRERIRISDLQNKEGKPMPTLYIKEGEKI